MRFSLLRSLLVVGSLMVACRPSFAATLTINAQAQSFNSDWGVDPGSFYAFGSLFIPGTGYEMTSAGGRVMISADGNSSSSTGPSYTSWESLVAAESGQWTLKTNPGLASETTYFFNVGFGDIHPLPIWIDAYHVEGTPADQARVKLSGPLDSPYTLFYGVDSPGGFISGQYTLSGGQDFIDLTVPMDFTSLFLAASRSTYTQFSITTPTTTDGIALSDWGLSPYNGYAEGGSFLTYEALRSVSVPDSTDTLLLVLVSVTGLAALQRATRRHVKP